MKKFLIAILVVLGVLAGFVTGYRVSITSELKGSMRVALYDPDSAQFRNLRLRSDWTREGSVLCGEMNARNLLGGYGGYRKFAAVSPTLHYIDDDELVDGVCEVMRDGNIPWWYLGRGG